MKKYRTVANIVLDINRNIEYFSCYQAASVAGCSDLASLERSVFISSGGAGDWLRKCPAKLVKLEEVNMLLCRNPRLIKHHHIKVNFTLQ